MTEGLWAALIGVGGTILGTMLGFLLGKIDFGVLKIHALQQKEQIKYTPRHFGDLEEKFEKLECWFTLSLYNCANHNQVFRNARVVFKDALNKEIYSTSLLDLSTKRESAGIMFTDFVGIINVPPKSGLDRRLKFECNDYEKLIKAKSVHLVYYNAKFRKKSKSLWTRNYSNLKKQNHEINKIEEINYVNRLFSTTTESRADDLRLSPPRGSVS